MCGMSTGRRVLTAIAITGAAAAASPAVAGAQGPVPGCSVPHAWSDAPVAAQYELDLFLGQTQFDLERVTSGTAAAFVSVTAKRATSLTSALAGVATSVVVGGIAQPPSCP
jgi:hypothetical protein